MDLIRGDHSNALSYTFLIRHNELPPIVYNYWSIQIYYIGFNLSLIHASELKATQLNTGVLEIVGKDFFFFQNVKIWKKILYVIMELKEIKKNLQEFFF